MRCPSVFREVLNTRDGADGGLIFGFVQEGNQPFSAKSHLKISYEAMSESLDMDRWSFGGRRGDTVIQLGNQAYQAWFPCSVCQVPGS